LHKHASATDKALLDCWEEDMVNDGDDDGGGGGGCEVNV
jgi:hypothetical protein